MGLVTLFVMVLVVAILSLVNKNRQALAEAPEIRVGLVGDSLSNQARTSATSKLNGSPRYKVVYYNAQNGFRIDQQMAAAKTAVQTEQIDYLIIELGTNDAAQAKDPVVMQQDITQFVANVKPYVRCARWYNIKTSINIPRINPNYNRYAPAFNRRLTNVISLPENSLFKITDYATWAINHQDAYLGDDIHFTKSGANAFGNLALRSANSCYNQVR